MDNKNFLALAHCTMGDEFGVHFGTKRDGAAWRYCVEYERNGEIVEEDCRDYLSGSICFSNRILDELERIRKSDMVVELKSALAQFDSDADKYGDDYAYVGLLSAVRKMANEIEGAS